MLKLSSVCVLLLLVGGIVLIVPQISSAQRSAPALYSLRTAGRPAAEAARSSIASVREAEIAFGSSGQELARLSRLTIPLFDEKEFEAFVTQTELRAADDITWRGKIRYAKTEGDVVITFRKGFFSGLIYGPDAVYEIVPRGDKHMLVELDQSLFPECGGAINADDVGAACGGR